jgi:hypothetical protein
MSLVSNFIAVMMGLIIERGEYPIFDLVCAAVNAAVHPIFRIGPAAIAHATATGEALTDIAVAVLDVVIFVLHRHWIFIG